MALIVMPGFMMVGIALFTIIISTLLSWILWTITDPSNKRTQANKEDRSYNGKKDPGGLIVALEGNISAGKSTLSNLLATSSDFIVIPEYVDPHLLKLFYQDMKAYAFLLQLTTKARRVGEVNLSSICKNDKIHIHDGCLLRDVVFALNHSLSGNMNQTETDIYGSCDYLKNMMVTLHQIDKIMYLHTTPKRCKEAAINRGAVDKEVSVDYLTLIDHLHFHGVIYLALQGKDVNILDWNDFGADAEDPILFFKDSLEERVTISYDEKDNCDKDVAYLSVADSLQPLPGPEVLFPKLPAQYRYVFSAESKQFIVNAFKAGKRVILTNKRESLTDIFASLSTIMKVS